MRKLHSLAVLFVSRPVAVALEVGKFLTMAASHSAFAEADVGPLLNHLLDPAQVGFVGRQANIRLLVRPVGNTHTLHHGPDVPKQPIQPFGVQLSQLVEGKQLHGNLENAILGPIVPPRRLVVKSFPILLPASSQAFFEFFEICEGFDLPHPEFMPFAALSDDALDEWNAQGIVAN